LTRLMACDEKVLAKSGEVVITGGSGAENC
jgi:hypothetical protein